MKRAALSGSNSDNFKVVGYIIGALVTISGGFFIWEIILNSNLYFSANWNMFESPIGVICIFIGFFMAIIWWGKFTHWSATPVVETRDSWGNVKRKEDYDISNQLLGKFMLPLLGHFIIEPLIYGAIIYYPLQCIIAIVGSIFPWIISLIVVGVIVAIWVWNNNAGKNVILFTIGGLLLIVGFAVGAYFIHPESVPSYTPNIEETYTPETGGEDIDESQFEDVNIDESEFE